MESECRGAWADLPAELLALISDELEERCDITRFRGVCRTWRSSVMGITNNKLSHLFPRRLSLSRPSVMGLWQPCESDLPKYVVAIAVYLVKDPKSSVANWIVSVQESESGKLLLRNLLTCLPIPGYKGYGFDMLSGWTLTRLSSYHCFRSTCSCFTCCREITKAKVVLLPAADGNSNSMVTFRLGDEYGGVRALRLSNEPTTGQLVAGNSAPIADFVNFNGCIYAVDDEDAVYVLDNAGLQMVRLTCVNLPRYPWASWETAGGKRFVVSDGDLYLVFNFCVSLRCIFGEYDHYKVYKLVMNDLNAPTCYHSERTENLGDILFFITKDCSFSVSSPFVWDFVWESSCCRQISLRQLSLLKRIIHLSPWSWWPPDPEVNRIKHFCPSPTVVGVPRPARLCCLIVQTP